MSVQKIAGAMTRQTNAVVVSAGLMEKTVKVRVGVQKWNKHIGKHFNRSRNILVHDPNSSLRIGDVISISPGWRASKQVHHVVNSILAPFGEPIEARPPVPTVEERIAEKEAKRKLKEGKRRMKAMGELPIVEAEVKGGDTVVQAARAQEIRTEEVVQSRSAKRSEETVVSEPEAEIQEVKAKEKALEQKVEEEAQKPKSWWRI